MRSRPYVTLKVPAFVHPGSDVKLTVVVESTSVTPIEWIDVLLIGKESARDEENRSSQTRVFLEESARISGEKTLEEDTYRFEASLKLPDDAPLSYTGYLSDIEYSVRTRVSIAWWLDATAEADLIVSQRPGHRPERAGAFYQGEAGGGPFLEIAVDDRVFGPGEEITGAIALGDVQGHLVQGVSLSLIGRERLRLRLEREYEAHRTTTFLKASSDDEGREIPFRFRIPRDVAPTFDAGLVALSWAFEARMLGHYSAGQIVPLHIGAFTSPPTHPQPRRAIGSGRWRDIWAEAASNAGLDLAPGELRMEGSIEGCDASVRIEAGDDARPGLTAELEWPSWEIDLRISPSSLRARVFGADDDVFGSYRVEGRYQVQAREAVTRPLRRSLLGFDSIEMSDERALVRSRDPGKELAAIEQFVRQVRDLAAAIQAAASRIAPPPPFADSAPEVSALARDLGGRFVPGSMAIRGASFEAGVFDIELLFPERDEPARTRVALPIDPPLQKPFDPENPADLAAARFDAAARQLVGELREGGARLLVAPGGDRIEVELSAVPAPRPLLFEKMRAMLALRERLSGDRKTGFYR